MRGLNTNQIKKNPVSGELYFIAKSNQSYEDAFKYAKSILLSMNLDRILMEFNGDTNTISEDDRYIEACEKIIKENTDESDSPRHYGLTDGVYLGYQSRQKEIDELEERIEDLGYEFKEMGERE